MARVRPILKLMRKVGGSLLREADLSLHEGVRARLRAGKKVRSFAPDGGRMKVVFDDGEALFIDALKHVPGAERVKGDAARNLLIRKMFRPYVKEGGTTRFIPVEGETLLGRAGRTYGQAMENAPVGTMAATAMGGLFLGQTVGGAIGEVGGAEERIADIFDTEMHNRGLMEEYTARNSAQALTTRANIERLAQLSPHLYNEIAYGRRFAPGDEPVGGRPDEKKLEQIAMWMAQQGAQL